MFSHAEEPLSFHTDKYIDRDNTVDRLYNGHHGNRGKWPLKRGGRYGEVELSRDKFYLGSTTSVIELSSCLLHPIMLIQS